MHRIIYSLAWVLVSTVAWAQSDGAPVTDTEADNTLVAEPAVDQLIEPTADNTAKPNDTPGDIERHDANQIGDDIPLENPTANGPADNAIATGSADQTDIPTVTPTNFLTIEPPAPNFDSKFRQVEVADAFLELHTGPGRGFPIFHVIERGDFVVVKKRRTDWFLIESQDGIEGWSARDQMANTLEALGIDLGEPVALDEPSRLTYYKHRWELGFMAGDFAGADVISVTGAYVFTPNLSMELALSQALGSVSDSDFVTLNLTHHMFPDWRVSPYFSLGGGMIRTNPSATLVSVEDRENDLVVMGLGVRGYLARRFVMRLEYKSYVILTSRDENEEIDEWKAGFNFFF